MDLCGFFFWLEDGIRFALVSWTSDFFFFFSSRRRHTRCLSDLEFRRVLFRSRRRLRRRGVGDGCAVAALELNGRRVATPGAAGRFECAGYFRFTSIGDRIEPQSLGIPPRGDRKSVV